VAKLPIGLMVLFSFAFGLSQAEEGSSVLDRLGGGKKDSVAEFEVSNIHRLLKEYQSPCAGEDEPNLSECFPEHMKPVRTLADDPIAAHVSVVISKKEISLNGKPLIQLEERNTRGGGRVLAIPEAERKGQLIARLADLLDSDADYQKRIGESLGIPGIGFNGAILLSVDEEVPFEIVRQVMYTAGQAQFGEFAFVGFNRWQDELVSFSTTLPAIGEPMPYDQEPVFSLRINVVVMKEGFSVRTNDSELDVPGSRDADAPDLPCLGGRPCEGVADYPWVGFNAWLSRAKAKYPNAATIIIAPEGAISWDILARTMDYARSEPFLDMDASQADWSTWKTQRKDLFPLPVVAGGTALTLVAGGAK
jgi:hypothetical protein